MDEIILIEKNWDDTPKVFEESLFALVKMRLSSNGVKMLLKRMVRRTVVRSGNRVACK